MVTDETLPHSSKYIVLNHWDLALVLLTRESQCACPEFFWPYLLLRSGLRSTSDTVKHVPRTPGRKKAEQVKALGA